MHITGKRTQLIIYGDKSYETNLQKKSRYLKKQEQCDSFILDMRRLYKIKKEKNEEDVNEEVQRQPTMTNHNQVNWFIIIIFVGKRNKKKTHEKIISSK